MKAILLARVSSKEQENGQSIPAQERRLREYAARKEWRGILLISVSYEKYPSYALFFRDIQ